jgi:hydroxymethylpyrimidine/phosphomethylpyrimidine kinase
VLAIAGSDSGGGAGIQADLKAFAACGVHGMTAITAVTVQNTVGVSAVHTIPPEVIVGQARAVIEDIGVDVVKVGMLGSAASACAVADVLALAPRGTPIVVDPVMVAESGARLLEPAAQRVLVEQVLPYATVITPNLPEARALAAGAGAPAPSCGDDEIELQALAGALLALGPASVVITGGHRARAEDLFVDRERSLPIPGARERDGAAHGSGCTHSSVIAALMALGADAALAALAARAIAGAAVARGLRDVGAGPGPVDVIGLEERRRLAVATLLSARQRLP